MTLYFIDGNGVDPLLGFKALELIPVLDALGVYHRPVTPLPLNPQPPRKRAQHPHGDPDVLHAPSECVHCDKYPDRQRQRLRHGVNFTREDLTKDSRSEAVPCSCQHVMECSPLGLDSGIRCKQVVWQEMMASTTQPTPTSGPTESRSECVHQWTWLTYPYEEMICKAPGLDYCRRCGALKSFGRTLVPDAAQTPSTSQKPDSTPSVQEPEVAKSRFPEFLQKLARWWRTRMSETEATIRAAALVLVDAALQVIETDPHSWSSRPCSSCRVVSNIANRPFGCYALQAGAFLRYRGDKE